MSDTWRPRPIYAVILEVLRAKGGMARDKELYDSVRSEYSISFADFLKALMVLELRGFVRVRLAKEDLRQIELVED